MPRYTRPARLIAALPAAGLTLTVLTACGGGADTAAGSDTQQTAADGATGATGSTSTPNTTQGRGARQMPGASGKIAEVSGSTMQVQNTSTQTAVTWTKDTKITDTVSAGSSDLAVGKCIAVTPTSTDSTTSADESAPVAAASISITDAVDGECGFGGFPGGGGAVLRGNGGRLPDGAQFPNGGERPDGANAPQGNRVAFRGGAGGKVVSIDGDSITIEVRRPVGPTGAATAPPDAGEATTSKRTVTFSSATTWTRTVSADADALEVGRCVTALGTAGSTGAVTATSIVVRSATDGECTGGFMGRAQAALANSTAGA